MARGECGISLRLPSTSEKTHHTKGSIMIHVIAAIEVKPGKREAFLTEFRKLIPPVRAEAGCIEYGPAIDLPTGIAGQVPERKDVIIIVEKWKSLDDLR